MEPGPIAGRDQAGRWSARHQRPEPSSRLLRLGWKRNDKRNAAKSCQERRLQFFYYYLLRIALR